MISAIYLPVRSEVLVNWPAIVVATFSGVALLQFEPANLLIALVLIGASLTLRGFWLLVVPSLVCFGGLELSVFLDPQASGFATPLNAKFLPETWLVCLVVRSLAYWIGARQPLVDQRFLWVGLGALLLLSGGSLTFLMLHDGLPFLNKAPLKLVSFVLLTGVVVSEARRVDSADLIWRGLVYATVIGAFQRLLVLGSGGVKEPGVYAYTGVFVTACMIFLVSRLRPVSKFRWLLVGFWSLMLLMHVSASRTQLALLGLTVVILLRVLSVRSVPMIAVVGTAAAVALPFVQRDFLNYILHKLNFFLAVLSASGRIGDSASVRESTFLNLVDGSQTDVLNLIVGRGLWGYMEFSAHPDAAIYTEGAFSEIEHSMGVYYHLHFFLNEVVFYFGFAGLACLLVGTVLAVRSSRHPLELVLLVYFVFNFMFRLELILLVPAAMIAWRRKLAISNVFDGLGRLNVLPGLATALPAGQVR